jgi:hypothetical protein
MAELQKDREMTNGKYATTGAGLKSFEKNIKMTAKHIIDIQSSLELAEEID